MKNYNHIVLVRPANFGYNFETAQSNRFQKQVDETDLHEKAIREFDNMVTLLQDNQLSVKVFQDSETPSKPDCIFPNNWISFHPHHGVVLYPMEAENRRFERRTDIIDHLQVLSGNQQLTDLTSYETEGQYLEGTGSVIFDPVNEDAYACISSRTDARLFSILAKELHKTPISFEAFDLNGYPIYHTNVMLSIGENSVIICSESITDPVERIMVTERLKASGRVVIEVNFRQMNQFCCNVLEVDNQDGEPFLIMSSSAYNGFTEEQLDQIKQRVGIIVVDITTIENVGGGSARCMQLGVKI